MYYPKVKMLQDAHCLTDADMGRIINKTAATYRKKVAGISPLYSSEALALCRYFRVSLDYLFTREGEND